MKYALYGPMLSLLLLGAMMPQAIASTYSSDSGKTQLSINESQGRVTNSGFYVTQLGNEQWRGSINISRMSAGAGHIYYEGKFSDSNLSVGRGDIRCSGDILLDRTGYGGVAPIVSMRVKWTIQSGKHCPSAIGTVFETRLTETLPKADRQGEYTSANSYTVLGETNDNGIWPLWQVIAADGKLNCRETPKGKVLFTYKSGDQLKTANRGMQIFATATDGSSWMKVPSKACYVKANQTTIEPVSVPY